MFVLPVRFSMVTNDPVGVCNRGTFDIGRGNLSVTRVVESLEQTDSEIHVTDWVDSFREVDASWHLSISVSPVVLDALHVHLVDNDYNFVFFA